MGQPFYGPEAAAAATAAAAAAVDYTNPYLVRTNDYYRNPYGMYHPGTSGAVNTPTVGTVTDRRYAGAALLSSYPCLVF